MSSALLSQQYPSILRCAQYAILSSVKRGNSIVLLYPLSGTLVQRCLRLFQAKERHSTLCVRMRAHMRKCGPRICLYVNVCVLGPACHAGDMVEPTAVIRCCADVGMCAHNLSKYL